MSGFDYGGFDIGATMLKEKAYRELEAAGEISLATQAHLAANKVSPPSRSRVELVQEGQPAAKATNLSM